MHWITLINTLSSPFLFPPEKNWSLLKWLLFKTDSRATHSRHLNGIASVYPLIGRDSHTLYTRKADSLQNNTEKKESVSDVSLRERTLLIPQRVKSYDWHGKLERNNIPGQPPQDLPGNRNWCPEDPLPALTTTAQRRRGCLWLKLPQAPQRAKILQHRAPAPTLLYWAVTQPQLFSI